MLERVNFVCNWDSVSLSTWQRLFKQLDLPAFQFQGMYKHGMQMFVANELREHI